MKRLYRHYCQLGEEDYIHRARAAILQFIWSDLDYGCVGMYISLAATRICCGKSLDGI